jgi:hypothetical protein
MFPPTVVYFFMFLDPDNGVLVYDLLGDDFSSSYFDSSFTIYGNYSSYDLGPS